ncbi:XTP/dITP diphosphohydrolase [Pseudarcicella hirudinis]|uniref:dITP/XTP pyrophosphatase n=1 Tax=Pseudarcicella hirudinis TaxID=1079859 RepID=A0A1I5UF73_9BACT|nr:RdgB/HAM1 family non-canonical purine NTP pyrophosphatase [Pseudarcicella hirudinis]SFP93905.1 XTP/dITP diphosphohydrolase [Pseudarcicella hirudinis]
MKTKLCFASNNQHKVEEIKALLGDNFELLTLNEIGCEEELPETGNTMEANSLQKAQYLFDHYKINCFADDSGLEVAALGGEPGVYSARYAGEHRSNADNISLLLKNLEGKEDLSACFRTVITLIRDGVIHQFDGRIDGSIIRELRGDGGFGYDPVFIPSGQELTFAEMSMEQKSKISHRARAFQKFVDYLKNGN